VAGRSAPAATARRGAAADGIRYNPPSWDDPHHRAWLAAFLADEPAWRPRLERWIDEAG